MNIKTAIEFSGQQLGYEILQGKQIGEGLAWRD